MNENEFSLLKEKIGKNIKDYAYFNILEKNSLRLQNRASNIIKNLEFDKVKSNKELIDAIIYFKEKKGKISKNAPIKFMNIHHQKMVLNKNNFKISLYKAIFFIKILEAIRSGSLVLKYSYINAAIN